MEHIAYPSTEQFRNVIKEVQYHHKNEKQPTLEFMGSVKLHGTNASVCKSGTEYWCQSRNNIITPDADNAGFAAWAYQQDLDSLFSQIPADVVVVYGEWCGGNIQSGVAISGLPKMFVIFKILADGVWLSPEQVKKVKTDFTYNIWDFQTWSISIDFDRPGLIQNKLIELTEAVERECPVGKAFGSIGVGEGIVWTCVTPGYSSSRFTFKVKGEKHSVSKVKVLAAVDVEKVGSVNEFVDNTLTEARLNQGLEFLREQGLAVDQTSTGAFLKWIVGDILKEETDTMEASLLDKKDVTGVLSKKAREWFFSNF
jgi:hypothetical protein